MMKIEVKYIESLANIKVTFRQEIYMCYWQEHIDDGDDIEEESPEEIADRLYDAIKNGDYDG